VHGITLTFILLAAAIADSTALAAHKQHVDDWTGKYDSHFRKNTKHYFGPGFDWRWFKAQAIAESGLDPDAKSKTGALGIMQILPSTYQDILKKNPHFKDIQTPRWNIAAGIYYVHRLYSKWRSPPPGDERLYFSFGSYNAGYGRISRIFKKVEPPEASWELVEYHVPGQTRHYVRRIRRLMDPKDPDEAEDTD